MPRPSRASDIYRTILGMASEFQRLRVGTLVVDINTSQVGVVAAKHLDAFVVRLTEGELITLRADSLFTVGFTSRCSCATGKISTCTALH